MNYGLWIGVIIGLLGILFSGGFCLKLRDLARETSELMDAVADALDDGNVDNADVIRILKEMRDVGVAAVRIAALFKGRK